MCFSFCSHLLLVIIVIIDFLSASYFLLYEYYKSVTVSSSIHSFVWCVSFEETPNLDANANLCEKENEYQEICMYLNILITKVGPYYVISSFFLIVSHDIILSSLLSSFLSERVQRT